MYNFKSIIVKKGQLLPGIHGLRGVAALAVVLYHLNHLAGIVPPDFFRFIGRDFGYSVHLFFILSAFSLMHSTASRIGQPNWLPEYFLKRFFRIVPLFYFMIIFEIIRQIISSGSITSDLNSIFLNLTLSFGFVPSTGLVWGGWSVGVEIIFYAIFPVLILTIRAIWPAFILFLFAIMVSYFIRSALHMQHVASVPQAEWDWSYFSFASNICFFAMGIYAYYISRLYKESISATRIISILAIIIIGGLMFFDIGTYLYSGGRGDIVMWGLGLMALCIWQSISPSILIANTLFEYLGERSFSIYLLHPPVIYFSKTYLIKMNEVLQSQVGFYAFFVCAISIIALVLIFSEVTYRFIEVSGIKFGRKLISLRKPALVNDKTVVV